MPHQGHTIAWLISSWQPRSNAVCDWARAKLWLYVANIVAGWIAATWAQFCAHNQHVAKSHDICNMRWLDVQDMSCSTDCGLRDCRSSWCFDSNGMRSGMHAPGAAGARRCGDFIPTSRAETRAG